MLKLSFHISALAVCAVLPAQQFAIPNGTHKAEGSTSTNVPWGYGAANDSRVMYGYGPSHFTKQGISGPTTITRLRYRGDGGGAVKYAGGGSYGSAIIKMSTMPGAISTLTTGATFAGKHGKDVVEVFNGAVAVAKLSGTSPNDWHIDIILQKPFTYDPSSGKALLVEMSCDSKKFTGPSPVGRHDLHSATDLQRMYHLTDKAGAKSTGSSAHGAVVEITTPMYADVDSVAIKTGGTQKLTINATLMHANKNYWIFGSVTGTKPGVNLLGIHIPLNPDLYTDLTICCANTKELANFRGKLAANGTANASFNIPANVPVPVGFKIYHSVVVYDATKFHLSSGAISVTFK